ncbi:diguanylate cyclase [Saccharophagus degradans]|uniref:diguanylate cyclase n=1 Tax=Saccharophagus degradans TaxID=86304 RepID=A0AAW7X189_9GAMM|nr:diguanylate cyclase [Saccharophagus degradans]MDO6421398.1 diguanylate cyclase [Saccharophagus degradans]MDO6608788.1 diguanylate cyclase [Saccharophagus degradans]
MIRINPAVRLSFGLVILMLSILLLAQALGLTPNIEKKQLAARQQISETLAFQVLLAMSRMDERLLQQMIDNAVMRNPELESAGVRFPTGGYMRYTEDHDKKWLLKENNHSSPEFVEIPLVLSGVNRGALEITYVPLTASEKSYLGLSNTVLLVLFLCCSAFIGFWFFIKRALHHLDPSSVVPARVRNAMNVLAEGVFILDKREQIVLVNTALTSKLKSDERRLLGRKASALGWKTDSSEKTLPWEKTIATGEKQMDIRLEMPVNKNETKVFRVNAVPILDEKGNNQGVIASFDDVSELEAKNEQLQLLVGKLAAIQGAIEDKNRKLEYLASRDPLTDCYNRRAMRERLDDEFAKAQNSGKDLVCIMLDIDHFKRVNDTYGHGVGDVVIKMVAQVVKEAVRDSDIVARFGGEEFCVVLPNATVEQVKIITKRCRMTIETQNCGGVKVTSSFGIAALSLGAKSPNDLIHQADEALYNSKQNGRNMVSVWHKSMAIESGPK